VIFEVVFKVINRFSERHDVQTMPCCGIEDDLDFATIREMRVKRALGGFNVER